LSQLARVDRDAAGRWSGARWLLLAACLTASAYVLGVGAGPRVLGVATPLVPADVIVVLGGDAPTRAAGAGALFQGGYGAHVLVSGGGDCEDNRAILLADGVPASAIVVECLSGSTWENAAVAAPILARLGARRVILVTTWWHMRRARDCFQRANPALDIRAGPVGARAGLWRAVTGGEGRNVTAEYLKLAWYAMRAAARS
jgi:uncharacterized SAM-binding protein YcdF (DUF218 family)